MAAEVLLFHDTNTDTDINTDSDDCSCDETLEDTPLDSAMRLMDNQIMDSHIMSQTRGGTDMARKCVRFKNVRDRRTGRLKRVCAQYSGGGLSGIGTLPALGQEGSLRASFASIKGLLVTGAIAAGGVVITQKVFNLIEDKIALTGIKRHLAVMATGIAIGLVVGKVFKKPRLGANIAIGPIVMGALEIFGELMGGNGISGLGLTTIQPAHPVNPYMSGLGVAQVGPGIPKFMMDPSVDPSAMAGATIGI